MCCRDSHFPSGERALIGWCLVELVGWGLSGKRMGLGWWGVGMVRVDGVAGMGTDG